MMMKALRLFLVITALLSTKVSYGQCVNAYKDNQELYFYIFDDGMVFQQEFLIPLEWKTGNDYVVYIDRNNNFKIYKYGFSETLQPILPEQYWANDFLLTYINKGNIAFTLYRNKVVQLGPWVKGDLAVGDSIIAFRSNLDEFKVFYNGNIDILDIRTIERYWANENIVAYVDPAGQFVVYHKGEKYILTSATPPRSSKIDKNVVAYIDYTGNFNIFYDGEVYEIEAFQPLEYNVGENMVAYITQNREFKVFYDGDIYDLSMIPPNKYEMKENMLVFVDQSNFFNVFYKGEKKQLERYIPASYQMDNDLLVYETYDGYLLGYEEGNKKEISKEVVNFYQLSNRSVLFYKVPTQMKMYCNDRVYELF